MPVSSEVYDYLKKDLISCKLCEWQCGVNRLEDEIGVCGITIPEVSSSQLHPAPPASFDAFMTGCCFRCLFCQNWTVANYPANDYYESIEGYYSPSAWAELAVASLQSPPSKLMGADRLFFTGGEPTCSLPWIEEAVKNAKEIEPTVKVNYDTNGFMTSSSLERILSFTDSITFDIKAYDPKLFSALTGASVEPVLRNAEYIAQHASEKLWEFRLMVIPSVHDEDLEGCCEFISGLNPELPVNFLAFRPNFVMEGHSWTSKKFMDLCIKTAKSAGLVNVSWSGRTKDPGLLTPSDNNTIPNLMEYAYSHGCIQKEHRYCGECEAVNKCKIKRYTTDNFH